MSAIIVLGLSGPLCSGKSLLANTLERDLGASVVRARAILETRAGVHHMPRAELQRFGAILEQSTTGSWLSDAAEEVSLQVRDCKVVVDAVRTIAQLIALRRSFGARLRAVHLTASEGERRRRFEARRVREPVYEALTFDMAMSHETESNAEALGPVADMLLDTTALALEDVVDAVETYLATT